MFGVASGIFGVSLYFIWRKYHDLLEKVNSERPESYVIGILTNKSRCQYGHWDGPEICKEVTDWYKAAVILSVLGAIVTFIFIVSLIHYICIKCRC